MAGGDFIIHSPLNSRLGRKLTEEQCCAIKGSGQVVGNILILNLNGTMINIPLHGVGQTINLSELTSIQIQALKNTLTSSTLCDAFGNPLGGLL